jgi:hypothetical protein
MEVPSILILLTAFALTSCQTTDGPPFTDADLVAKRIDYDHRPLPADPKHLTIQGPDGAIHFTVPAGWHIAHQPSPNFPSYSLTHVGTFGDLPFLTVTLETGKQGPFVGGGLARGIPSEHSLEFSFCVPKACWHSGAARWAFGCHRKVSIWGRARIGRFRSRGRLRYRILPDS